MQNQPFFVQLHNMEQALAAFSHAQKTNCVLMAVSPPNVVDTHGSQWFIALCSEAGKNYPRVAYRTLFQCGLSAGYALAALQAGADMISLDPDMPPTAVERLTQIAHQMGRQIITISEIGLADGGDLLKSSFGAVCAPPDTPQETVC